MTTVAPGWYPDPSGNGGQRWWDGTTWTEHAQAPYTHQTSTLTAPEGAATNTPWIWLIIVLPVLTYLPLLFLDWGSMFAYDPSDPTAATRATLAMYTNPAFLLTTVGSWVVYGLTVFFAYRDYRFLTDQGVPRPFHWAFAFISSYVYPIGRAVVVKRRTGRDGGVLAASIVAIVLLFVLVIALVAIIVAEAFEAVANVSGTF